uniref:ATP synthase protein 8 n=1 Tax=Albinaria turrita TaxID=27820 RepID=ATP8_ALBTU|nr:RecName: Full=ATP synthase protein 8; AltName: Full=A6L; AltName: Full=F-ATPase subunit 8 [Albinaria turrita]
MPQLSPINGFVILCSISLMLLTLLINGHFMLKPISSLTTPKLKMAYIKKLYF